jgi:quinate dehydrogenase (quinone)
MERITTLPTLTAARRNAAGTDREDIDRRGVLAGKVLGGLIAAIGIALAGGGLWLILLEGYILSGVLLWMRRASGAWLAAGLFGATLCWALWEAGLYYWALFPRVLVPAGLAVVALLASLRFPGNRSRRAAVLSAGWLAALVAVELAFAFVPHDVTHRLLSRPFVVTAAKSNQPSDWYSYGRTGAGTRYSPFTQINRENVGNLQSVWTFRSGDNGPGILQDTPLQIGDTIYTCSRNNRIAALDADTGEVRWGFDSGVQPVDWAHCRGVGYYELPEPARDEATARPR